jgi:hypothetical protein
MGNFGQQVPFTQGSSGARIENQALMAASGIGLAPNAQLRFSAGYNQQSHAGKQTVGAASSRMMGQGFDVQG